MERRNKVFIRFVGVITIAGLISFACGPLYPSVPKKSLRMLPPKTEQEPQPQAQLAPKNAAPDTAELAEDLNNIVLMGKIAKEWLKEYAEPEAEQELSSIVPGNTNASIQSILARHTAYLKILPEIVQVHLRRQLSEFPEEIKWSRVLEETLQALAVNAESAETYIDGQELLRPNTATQL